MCKEAAERMASQGILIVLENSVFSLFIVLSTVWAL